METRAIHPSQQLTKEQVGQGTGAKQCARHEEQFVATWASSKHITELSSTSKTSPAANQRLSYFVIVKV